jgi:hypothetical protein
MDVVSAKLLGRISGRPFLRIVRFLTALALRVFGERAEDVGNRAGLRWALPILRCIHSDATPSCDAVMVCITRLGRRWGMGLCGVGVTLLLLYGKRVCDARFFAVTIRGTAILSFVENRRFGRDRSTCGSHPPLRLMRGVRAVTRWGTRGVVAARTCLVGPTRLRWPSLLSGWALCRADWPDASV